MSSFLVCALVRSRFRFCICCGFTFYVLVILPHSILFLFACCYCVGFSFFGAKQNDCLGRMSRKLMISREAGV